MRVLLVALVVLGCERGVHDPPAVAPPPPPPPTPAQPLACGEVTCATQEICIETVRAGGVAPPPGTQRGPAIRHRCAPAPDPDCTTVDSRHQRCFEKIPSAPRR